MYETILICLEQKVQLVTEIMNFTKQMEVKSRQEVIKIDDLINKRNNCIGRIQKCDLLIQKNSQLLPADDQAVLSHIFNNLSDNTSYNEEQLRLVSLSEQYQNILLKVAEYNNNATNNVKKAHADIKNKLCKIKKNKAKEHQLYNV